MILSLALTVEARDAYTGHCQRLARYAVAFGKRVGLSDEELRALHRGGYLHDIGKIGIPDALLHKPGKLTQGEYAAVKQHTVVGDALCGKMRSLALVRPIVRHHHERLNGSGYPDGLRGDETRSLEYALRELKGGAAVGLFRSDLTEAFCSIDPAVLPPAPMKRPRPVADTFTRSMVTNRRARHDGAQRVDGPGDGRSNGKRRATALNHRGRRRSLRDPKRTSPRAANVRKRPAGRWTAGTSRNLARLPHQRLAVVLLGSARANVAKLAIRMLIVALLAGLGNDARAQERGAGPNLALATIEELMNIKITSASRKEQSISDTAAAVYVITSEDIVRSGVSTLPDLLRFVPGIQVARLDSNKWAISARGIGSIYSHMLLVLIDGRSVYNRSLSTVSWDMQDLVLDDIDRIEVVRGPGGSVWGANAVNGVINIITKSASATQGALVRLRAGTRDGTAETFRFGGSVAGGDYRVHLQQSSRGGLSTPDGRRAQDDWNVLSGGFRMDWTRTPGFNVSVQGGAMTNEVGTVGAPDSRAHTQHVLASAVRQFENDSQFTVQGFVSHEGRHDPLAIDETTTIDTELQYRLSFRSRHDLVTGAGFRRIGNTFDVHAPYSVASPHVADSVLNTYAQDELKLAGDRLRVTLGTKLERDSTVGFGLQPSGRVLWAMANGHQVWGGVSRALHTPGRLLRDFRFETPPTFDPVSGFFYASKALDNPNLWYEVVLSREVGYRATFGSTVSLDLAAYRNAYHDVLIWRYWFGGFQFNPPPPHVLYDFQIGNALKYDIKGVELLGRWAPSSRWHLEAGWSRLDSRNDYDKSSAFLVDDDTVPPYTLSLRSRLSVGRLGLDASALRVARHDANRLIGMYSTKTVPAYTRLDVNASWQPRPQVSLAITGQNLVGSHMESTGTIGFAYTLDRTPRVPLSIPRNLGVTLNWRF